MSHCTSVGWLGQPSSTCVIPGPRLQQRLLAMAGEETYLHSVRSTTT